MGNNFNKFKKKILLEVLIKSLVYGLCAGLITFSVPLIYIKVKEIDFKTIYLVLIGLGIMIIISSLVFLIIKPNNKKIAKRLDTELNLNEKVQTMIEFEQEDNLMVNIQRENTKHILSTISLKKLTMKFSIFFFVLITIAVSISITALAIPSKETPSGPVIEDPDYDADNWTIQSIKDLIEEVEASEIDNNLKTKYVEKLNNLITLVKDATKESQMKTAVLSTIDDVYLELDITNTNNEVYLILRDSSYTLVSSLASAINQLKIENVSNALGSFVILISGSKDAINGLSSEFGLLIKKSQLDLNNELVASILTFAEAINECKNVPTDHLDPVDDATKIFNLVNDAVKEAVLKNSERVIKAITLQKSNQDVANLIDLRLKEIFEITDEVTEEDKEHNNDQEIDPDDNTQTPPNQSGSGGMGTGEVLFGSDDSIFDPEKGTVEYGDVIASYYGTIVGQIEEGLINEELKEFFDQYYDMLFGKNESEE